MGQPFVHPTGVTIYDPEKCWNGYTLMPVRDVGAVLIDMNGNVVKVWKDLQGFPNKLLPGGYVMGSLGIRDTDFGYQDQTDLVQVDWDGNIVWKFDKKEYIEDEGHEPQWMARQHHDYQREGNTVGYYVPGMECRTDGGNTLILCHQNTYNTKISEKRLLDDVFIEVDWEGNIVWEWHASDHFHEMGFSDNAKNAIYRNPNMHENGGGMGDWLHINSMSVLGPNKWYDEGDERFHPDNIIWDGREANISAIIDKKTGKIRADLICLVEEEFDPEQDMIIFDQLETWKKTKIKGGTYTLREMLVPVFLKGECVYTSPSVMEIRDICMKEKDTLWDETKRLANPHTVYVDLSDRLYQIKSELLEQMGREALSL